MSQEEFVVRRAAETDVLALAAFAERTFRDAFAADNRPEDMDSYCREAFPVDVQARNVLDPAIETLLVEDDRQVLVAYAQLRLGALPEVRGPSPIELWRFYVDRGQHGRGLAQRLMAEVIEAAQSRGAETLWLGVWERNHRALAFYRKAGFVDIGSHTFVLGTDVQTDRLMVKTVRVKNQELRTKNQEPRTKNQERQGREGVIVSFQSRIPNDGVAPLSSL